MAVEAGLDAKRIQELDKLHVLHSWSVQEQISPMPIAGAEGRYFWDYDGNRYLDFASQLVNVSIGHQHPKVVAAIKEQADKLCTIGPPMAHETRSELARLLAEVTPGDLTMSFFTNGGAEANENAIKLARWYTGRHKIVARYRSYHGATAGAITLTGDPRRWAAEPGIPGVVQAIREVCDRHGILLILDEVMAGFGRTGRWFACEHWDVVPDILTTAKGINSGYVPLGAMTVSEQIGDWLRDHPFAGGLTYSGHPLACAAGVASIEAFREESVVENAAAMGELLADELPRLAERHSCVGDIRGLGLFWGLELVRDRATREPLVPFNASGEEAAPMARLVQAALKRGLYLFPHWNVVVIAPPLIVSRDELEEGLSILDEVLS